MHWTSFAAGLATGHLSMYVVWRASTKRREVEILEAVSGLMGIMNQAQAQGVDPDVLMRELKQMVG